MDAVLINSKGFGGNNASASILAPHVTRQMLAKRHGRKALSAHAQRNEVVSSRAQDYDTASSAGTNGTIYRFDHNVLTGDDIDFSSEGLRIRDLEQAVSLRVASPYMDMLED